MSMHLEGPWLNRNGKKKGKQKYASADAKRKAEALKADWEALMEKHTPKTKPKANVQPGTLVVSTTYRRDADQPRIASKNTGWEPCTKAPEKVYTGTKMKGIGTMHKSNSVPIFSDEEAIDIARMRR
jgi:hypothetical protein